MRRLFLSLLVVTWMTPAASAWRDWPPRDDDRQPRRYDDGDDGYDDGNGFDDDDGNDRDGNDRDGDGRDGDGRDANGRDRRPIDFRALEDEVLVEMNLFRKDPRGYVAKLEALRASMRGSLIMRPGETPIATQEGVSAVDEAIRVLARAPRRLPRLAQSNGLAAAAHDHASDLGRTGGLGHDGSDGSSPDKRVSRHGRWTNMVAENIAFGPTTAEDIVVGLLVDDGVPDRGHRDILLEGQLFFAGVACGPHPTYGATCVIDYASGFETGPVRKPSNNWRGNMGPR